jgi:uncharacterized membrane-anchored protein
MKNWLLRVILFLQLVGFIGLYAYHLDVEKTGIGYLIKCRPVDPRDLVSGDYVSLRYEISTLPEKFQASDYEKREVFVTLQRSGNGVWEVQDVATEPPAGGAPYLKGRSDGMEIKYGIERYYVPEGKGRDVPGDLYAEIVIQRGGVAQLRRLYSNGRPWPQ